MKIAKNRDEAWKLQQIFKGEPHGWIQWKGTDVCMDVWCECGESFHIDDTFAYYVQCPYCKTVYFCNGHIELIKLEEIPETHIAQDTDILDEMVAEKWIEEELI